MEPKEPELTQEEIDHIAWIEKIAEQSSFEQMTAPPTRPPVPIKMATVDEPVVVTEAHEDEDRSSATSGADFQQSFDHEVTYERSSPLLEPDEVPVMEPKEPELTQEEIDHIAWIEKIAEQSSFEQMNAPPTRPPVPIKMATVDEPVVVTEAHEDEDRSSVTSGADFQQSFDHEVTYERSSPLLEPVEEPVMEPKEPELTQEEIDHIAWIQKIAEQSSFEQTTAPPTRPPVPIRMATVDEPNIVTEAHEDEDRSSATSGADFQQSFDHEVTYERSSPLLEPVEIPVKEPKEPELTQEEIDHIAWIEKIAEQSSFEQMTAPPTRPPVPIRMATVDEPNIVTEAHEDEHRSSATSGADFQQSFDHEVTYERSSPLLEPVEEPVMEPKEPQLPQEEIVHIAWIEKIAAQSSFEQMTAPPTRPPNGSS
ncbi:Protein CBG25086 [Caenorhabditis briggsae]|uniref:Protein CBG25086 n=1 Tax=Caenorhabditis briggsae TaxID=6238 RepID=A8WM29_CAEBR|nr:Protein CBG25086 [Caenorhabditis briggsae]CAP21531.2 Protein CBG25086 [Caenorhabditis briggsae]